jgi:hypothetical protein
MRVAREGRGDRERGLWGYMKGLRVVEGKEEKVEDCGGGQRGQREMTVGYRKGLRVVEGKEERIEGCGRGIEGGGLKKRFEGGGEKGEKG